LLMKPDPFTSEMNRLVNTLFESNPAAQRWTPAIDLFEEDDHFVLKADLPGLSEEDISIEVQDNALTLAGKREADPERKERGWFRVERMHGAFSRSLSLPEGVDPERISARFDRGVLEVTIPKPEERKPRRITIAANGSGQQETIEGAAREG
ncbi:MAG: Hsp20/alpha crystallin family protein, partial [Thermoleophilaceae bacterium]|nr:Hsp20/alpha crystallin family protein [Thermoleophilaceae bacterium]